MNKAQSFDFRPSEGVVIVRGDDGSEVAIALAGLGKLAAHARTLAHQKSDNVTPQTWNVGRDHSKGRAEILLVADQGLESQISFALTPEHAHAVGQDLIASASEAPPTPPTSRPH